MTYLVLVVVVPDAPEPKLSKRTKELSDMNDVSVALEILVSKEGCLSSRYRREDLEKKNQSDSFYTKEAFALRPKET